MILRQELGSDFVLAMTMKWWNNFLISVHQYVNPLCLTNFNMKVGTEVKNLQQVWKLSSLWTQIHLLLNALSLLLVLPSIFISLMPLLVRARWVGSCQGWNLSRQRRGTGQRPKQHPSNPKITAAKVRRQGETHRKAEENETKWLIWHTFLPIYCNSLSRTVVTLPQHTHAHTLQGKGLRKRTSD